MAENLNSPNIPDIPVSFRTRSPYVCSRCCGDASKDLSHVIVNPLAASYPDEPAVLLCPTCFDQRQVVARRNDDPQMPYPPYRHVSEMEKSHPPAPVPPAPLSAAWVQSLDESFAPGDDDVYFFGIPLPATPRARKQIAMALLTGAVFCLIAWLGGSGK